MKFKISIVSITSLFILNPMIMCSFVYGYTEEEIAAAKKTASIIDSLAQNNFEDQYESYFRVRYYNIEKSFVRPRQDLFVLPGGESEFNRHAFDVIEKDNLVESAAGHRLLSTFYIFNLSTLTEKRLAGWNIGLERAEAHSSSAIKLGYWKSYCDLALVRYIRRNYAEALRNYRQALWKQEGCGGWGMQMLENNPHASSEPNTIGKSSRREKADQPKIDVSSDDQKE